MSDAPAPSETSNPNAPKRVMGGKPALPRVYGRNVANAPGGPGAVIAPDGTITPGMPSDGASGAGWQEVGDVPIGTVLPESAVPYAAPAASSLGPDGLPPVRGVPIAPESLPPGTPNFEHACCAAVRPTAPEVDADGNIVSPTASQGPEPYLESQGPIKPSAAFGVVLMALGLLGLGAAALALTGFGLAGLIVGIVAGVVLLGMLGTLLMMQSAMRGIRVQAYRHVLEPKLERGKLFHTRLDTSGSSFPGGLRIEVSDRLAPGLRPVEHATIPGVGQITYKVRPQGRGLLTFAGLRVFARSGTGLWMCEQNWRLRTTVEVEPSLSGVTWRALVTGYAPFDQSTPSSIVKLYRDIEHEVVRDYAAGDRLRDVNWKFFSRMGKMVIRQRSTEGETTILLVIDAGKTMLMDQAGFRNLDMAVEIAQEFADAGLRRNHEVGLLAFNEERIVDHVRPTRAKVQIKRLVQHFLHLADHHLPEEGEDPVEILIAGDPENLRLGFGQGIKQRNTATMTIVFFTDLQSTPEEIVQSLSKAAQGGQRVAVMLMAAPKLRPVQAVQTAEEADAEMRGVEHTNRMRELLIANGCEFLEMNPGEEDMRLVADVPSESPQAAPPKAAAGRPTATATTTRR